MFGIGTIELLLLVIMFGIGSTEILLLVAIVAAAVVMRNGDAIKQFSLRSLLIFMTFIALVLGAIVILVRGFN